MKQTYYFLSIVDKWEFDVCEEHVLVFLEKPKAVYLLPVSVMHFVWQKTLMCFTYALIIILITYTIFVVIDIVIIIITIILIVSLI